MNDCFIVPYKVISTALQKIADILPLNAGNKIAEISPFGIAG